MEGSHSTWFALASTCKKLWFRAPNDRGIWGGRFRLRIAFIGNQNFSMLRACFHRKPLSTSLSRKEIHYLLFIAFSETRWHSCIRSAIFDLPLHAETDAQWYYVVSPRSLAGSGQTDKALAFDREGHGFDFSHRRSYSPPGSPLLAATPFLKIDVHCLFIEKGGNG